MKPILYTAEETAFETNGIGILADAISCTVRQERTGVFELEMEYPLEGRRYSDLSLRRIILALPDNLSRPQPFRIYRISRPLDGVVTVYARHVAYDLMGIPVGTFTAASAPGAMDGLRRNAAVDCPFEFWTDKTTVADMTVKAPCSIWSLLGGTRGGVLDVYGGEYEFDRWTVKLHQQRGRNRGVTIRYGKNLTSLKQEENCANVYTGMYPYWADADGTLVELDGKIVNASGSYGFTRILTKDFSQEWQAAPTKAMLQARAERYMRENKIGVPSVSLDVNFVALEQTEEYSHLQLLEQVSLCDTVNVEFPKLGVSATAKCIAVEYDALRERYEKLEIGDARSTFAGALVDQEKQVEEITQPSYLQQAAERATRLIAGSRGGRVITVLDEDGKPMELCILSDADSLATATKLWRWNEGGLGFSKNGYNGPYTLAITKDGQIVADAITTGTLSASLIRTGDLAAGSVTMSGKFLVYDGDHGTPGGYVGYMSGSTDTEQTDGIGVSDATGHCYVIATGAGVRMQAGSTRLYTLDDGTVCVDGDLKVSGSITEFATL